MKRNFCLGSEWLYYKIYTGVKTADMMLSQKLYPVIADLNQSGVITKWFFIRYKDPDEHLRLRFLCDAPEKTALVIQALYPVFNELMENDLVWKLQADTYNREIERYGESTIEQSESIFHWDSEMIAHYIPLKPSLGDHNTELLFSFLAIDAFLDSFSLSNPEKSALMDELQLSFKKEFQADKGLKKELDKNYRELEPSIGRFLNFAAVEFPELALLVTKKQSHIAPLIAAIKEKSEISLLSFLQSHIHMMVNRQFTSRQRTYECLIYDHLHRYYKKSAFLKASSNDNK